MTDQKDPIQTTDSGHGNPPPKDKNDQTRIAVDSGHGEPPPKGGQRQAPTETPIADDQAEGK